MPPSDFASLTIVSVGQIDFSDRTFAVTPDWFPVDILTAAIRRVGLLCPPHVERLGPESYRVISGFRRLRAASSLGLNSFYGLVRSGDPGQLFTEALLENASIRPLHLLEKATAVWKLTQSFSITQARVIHEFLPLLGVKPNRFEMNRLLELSRLSRVVQEAMVFDGLEAEIALGVARWEGAEQGAFAQTVKALRPGFNRQKELFALLDELRGRDQISIVELLGAGMPENLDELLRDLRLRRFPRLTEYEQLYQEKKATLHLPPTIQFQIPPFFEGEKIQVGFAARSPEQLKALAAKLQEIADKPELAEIFGLL